MRELLHNVAAFFQENFFVFELLLCYIPYIPLVKLKKGSWWKIIICTIIMTLYSYFISWKIQSDIKAVDSLLQILNFSTMAGISFLGLYACMKESFWTALLCCVSAYSTQHIFFRIRMFTVMMLEHYHIDNEFVNYICYWTGFSAVLVFCYFFLTLRLKKEADFKVNNKSAIVWVIIALVATVILNSISMMDSLSAPLTVVFALDVYACLACLLLLAGMFNNAYNKTLKEELETLQVLWRKDKQQYEQSKENMKYINMKIHDMRYIINSLSLENENEGKEILEQIELRNSIYKTGNDVFDVVLSEKRLKCDKLGITLNVMVDGELLKKMSSVDVYSFFGNALDNAIECLKKVSEEENKVCSVLVKRVNRMIKIQIENYTPVVPIIEDGEVITTKEEKEIHGYGIKSMKYIINKYGGFMEISALDNNFSVDAFIPLDE